MGITLFSSLFRIPYMCNKPIFKKIERRISVEIFLSIWIPAEISGIFAITGAPQALTSSRSQTFRGLDLLSRLFMKPSWSRKFVHQVNWSKVNRKWYLNVDRYYLHKFKIFGRDEGTASLNGSLIPAPFPRLPIK